MNSYGAAVLLLFLIFVDVAQADVGCPFDKDKSKGNAGSSIGQVQHLIVHHGDQIYFYVGEHKNRPSCAKNNDEWAISLSSQTGKAMYALILMAQTQGKDIRVSGTCDCLNEREAPYLIEIKK